MTAVTAAPTPAATERHWLWNYTDGNERVPTVAQPWFIDGWTAATDGKKLLLVRGNVCDAPEPDPSGKVPAHLRQFLPANAPLTSPVPVVLGKLRKACGPALWLETCSSCDGSGEEKFGPECHRCGAHPRCEYCDGKGKTLADCRIGIVLGLPFDLNLLAQLVEHFDGEPEATVSVGLIAVNPDDRHQKTGKPWQQLVVDGPAMAWRAVLMQLHHSEGNSAILDLARMAPPPGGLPS